MASSLLVTIGTDGLKDWVQTPDGQKFSLGSVSVLSFVAKLVRSTNAAQKALSQFLKRGEALVSVDDDRMWALLAPTQSRWAAGPFMPPSQGDPSLRIPIMSTIREDLSAVRKVIGHLNVLAAKGERDARAVQHLIKLADKIKSPNQSKNQTYYNLGQPKVHQVGDAAPKPHTVNASDLAFDSYEQNMKLAKGILAKAEQTVATINRLASRGRKFNASRARADVAAVTTKVASICSQTELTESWVREDLTKLAARTDKLHGLFHPRAA
jgi:hypothetical protein